MAPGPGLAWLVLFGAALLALALPALGQDDEAPRAAEGESSASADGERSGAGAASGGGAGSSADGAEPEAPAAEPAALTAEEIAAEAAARDAAAIEAAETVMRTTHVGELAMRTRATLRDMRPLVRAGGDVSEIERRLATAEIEIARLSEPARLALIPHLSQRELAALGQEWRRHQTTFEAWEAMLAARGEQLEETRRQVVELRRTWAALRDASNALGRPEGRHERIVVSLDEVRAAGEALDAQRDTVTALEDRVSELVIVTEDVTEEIRAAAGAFRERLFVRERLPIWRGLGASGPDGAPTAADATGDGARSDASAEPGAGEHAAVEPPPNWGRRTAIELTMIGQQLSKAGRIGALFLVLCAAMFLLRRRSVRWEGDATLAIPLAVANRPLSAALLVTLVAVPLQLTHAPILFYDLLALLLLVPLARVLPPLVPPHARPLVYVLCGFLCLNGIEGMTEEGGDLRRVLLLLESVWAVAGPAVWARRSRGIADRRLGWLALLIAVVAAIALVANVLGWVFLATMLMRGTSFSVQSGLVLVTGVVVVGGLVHVAIRSEISRRLRGLREHGALVHRRLLRLATLGALVLWVTTTLSGYGLADGVYAWFAEIWYREWTVGSLVISVGRFVLATLILIATAWTSRIVRFVLELDVLPRLKLEPGVDGAVSGLSRYVIVGIGILLALASLGIDASQLALVAGALGVGVGFGLQGIVANFIAGLVLMLERPVRLGDRIEVGTLTGHVERIGLRSSTVRATDGSEVIVPNESLISRELVNWTLSDRKRRVALTVGVAYGTDPTRALEVIRAAVSSQAGVLGAAAGGGPDPEITFDAFGASSLDYIIKFWTADVGQADAIKSVVGIAVHDALVAAGIEIPFPQQDVRIVSLPAGAPSPAADATPPVTDAAPKAG